MPVSSTPPLGRTVAVGSACGSVERRAASTGAHGIKPSVETPPAGATHTASRRPFRVSSGCLPALAIQRSEASHQERGTPRVTKAPARLVLRHPTSRRPASM